MELVRLGKDDYDELLSLFNTVFSLHNGRDVDLRIELPVMWEHDEEHMKKHFGIREDGKLVAALGVYPLPGRIGDTEVLFSTVGNVATLKEYEGRGCMRTLMTRAMEELSVIGADASRLGGMRQRYNNYGYEACGTNYRFTLTSKNVQRRCEGMGEGIYFRKILRGDLEELRFAKSLYDKGLLTVYRSEKNDYRDVYLSMASEYNSPYLACTDSGEMLGYLCVGSGGKSVAEAYAKDGKTFCEMLVAYQRSLGDSLSIDTECINAEAVRFLSGICEKTSLASPNHFKIINFEKITDALLRLKSTLVPLPEGECTVGIEGCGVLRLFVKGKEVGAEKCEGGKEADISLPRLTAQRFLFGPGLPFETAAIPEKAKILSAWLPLPLCWNLQNRV